MGWRRSGRHAAMTLAVLAGVAVLAAGCGQSRPSAGRGAQLLAGRVEQLSPSTMSPVGVTAAEDAFSLALFDRVCPSKPGPNLLSPESADPGARACCTRGPRDNDRGVPRAAAPAARLEPGAGRGAAPAHRHAGRAGPARGQQSSLPAVREPARPAGARRPAYRLPPAVWGSSTQGTSPRPPTGSTRSSPARPTARFLPSSRHRCRCPPGRADRRPLPEGALAEPVPGDPARRRSTGDGRVVRVPLMRSAVPIASYRQAGG